jgi:hypothetical protein
MPSTILGLSLTLPIIGTNLTVGQVAAEGQRQGLEMAVAYHDQKKADFLAMQMGTPSAWHASASAAIKAME